MMYEAFGQRLKTRRTGKVHPFINLYVCMCWCHLKQGSSSLFFLWRTRNTHASGHQEFVWFVFYGLLLKQCGVKQPLVFVEHSLMNESN